MSLELYNRTYNYTFKKAKTILINLFKKKSAEDRPYSLFSNLISNWFTNCTGDYYINFPEEKYYQEAAKLFQKRNKLYVGDADRIIQLVLSNEIADIFKDKSQNEFESFVIRMARKDALQYIGRHLDLYYGYYQLLYETKSYKYFYLKDFEGSHFEESKEFKKMRHLKYPNLKEDRPFIIQDPKHSTEIHESKDMLSVEHSIIMANLNAFTNDERILLLHIVYSRRNSLSLIDFLRIVKIVGYYDDLNVFNNLYKDATAYSKARKGLEYYNSDTSQLKILKSLNKKLEFLDNQDLSDKVSSQVLLLKEEIKKKSSEN